MFCYVQTFGLRLKTCIKLNKTDTHKLRLSLIIQLGVGPSRAYQIEALNQIVPASYYDYAHAQNLSESFWWMVVVVVDTTVNISVRLWTKT